MGASGSGITEQLVSNVLQYGFPGVCLIVLAYVCRVLWADNKALRTALIETGQKAIQANADNTAALNRLTDLVNTMLRGKNAG